MVSNAAGGSPGLGCKGAMAADRVGVTGARHGRPSTVSIRPPRGELKKNVASRNWLCHSSRAEREGGRQRKNPKRGSTKTKTR